MRNKNWDKKELNQLYNVEGKTLQEIGDLRGVSRERVRQVMEEFGLVRGLNTSKWVRESDRRYYKSLEDFLKSPDDRQSLTSPAFYRLIKGLHCSECGRTKNIHVHHIVYPAMELKDVQILCASCHYAKHRKGITYMKQIDIYNQYMGGKTPQLLAEEYRVSRILIYKILRKIRNGNGSIRGENRLGRLSR